MKQPRQRTRYSSSVRGGSDDGSENVDDGDADVFFSGEFGLVGARQGDESYLDDRDDVLDDEGRIKFSQKKLYGREKELLQLHTIFDRIMTACRQHSGSDNDVDSVQITTVDPSVGDSQVVFLSGYSGCGKSALIQEFVKELNMKDRIHWIAQGKYDEIQTADPFSAIASALGRWCKSLSPQEVDEFAHVRDQMRDAIGQDAALLADLIPSLARIIFDDNDASVRSDNSPHHRDGTSLRSVSSIESKSNSGENGKGTTNKAKLKYVFHCFFQSLFSQKRPFLIFIDDMQWADDASLELFLSLLSDPTLKNFLFVGAFRSNEVDGGHRVTAVMKDLKSTRHQGVESIELQDLSRTDIAEFIADTLSLEVDEVVSLSDVIFSKTLGNIFYAMQATEELVRKNILYYDNICFAWKWNLTGEKLEDQLSADIIEMVRSKIKNMPRMLKRALIVSSYVRASFDVGTLTDIFASDIPSLVSKDALVKELDRAAFEGMLLVVKESVEYSFAHDRIQEAARSFLNGKEKDDTLIRIGHTLAKRGESDTEGEDWMLFTAAHYLNSVPLERHDRNARLKLANLNMRTAHLSLGVAAFDEAAKLLRAGIRVLDKETRWIEHYDLTLELFTMQIGTDFNLGNYDFLREGIDEILQNAKNLQDMGHAHGYSLDLLRQERKHGLVLTKGIEILKLHEIQLPSNLDDIPYSDDEADSLALVNRELSDLVEAPSIKDDCPLRVIDIMITSSLETERLLFSHELVRNAVRFCLQHGMSEYLPRILINEQTYYRLIKRDNQKAYEICKACQTMLDSILEIDPETQCKVGLICYSGFMVLRPMIESVDGYQEGYRQGMRAGQTQWAFYNAMSYGTTFYSAGCPITLLVESKFALFEADCRRFNQPDSMTAVFTMLRQLTLSLMGKSDNPVIFDGNAMTETSILSKFDPDSSPFKQTLRDLSTMKIMVACVVRDLATIGKMIEILKSWPDSDVAIFRGYMRMLWTSLGAFELSRVSNDPSYLELGKKYMKLFGEGAKNGNPNDRVAFLCLSAENDQSKKNYDHAIAACSEIRMLHVEALMNERCGLCQLARKKFKKAEPYLVNAIQKYHEWGATVKVAQMKRDHTFLNNLSLNGRDLPINGRKNRLLRRLQFGTT